MGKKIDLKLSAEAVKEVIDSVREQNPGVDHGIGVHVFTFDNGVKMRLNTTLDADFVGIQFELPDSLITKTAKKAMGLFRRKK